MINSPSYLSIFELINRNFNSNVAVITSSSKFKREYNAYLLEKVGRKILFNPPVRTFDEFVRNIFESKSMDGYKFISNIQTEIILYHIIKETNKNHPFVSIGQYINKMTFIRSIAKSVSDMRRNTFEKKYIHDELDICNGDIKQKDFFDILKLYEKVLYDNKLIDIEGIYIWLIDKIEETKGEIISDYDSIYFEYIFDLNSVQKNLVLTISEFVDNTKFYLPDISFFGNQEFEKIDLKNIYPKNTIFCNPLNFDDNDRSFLCQLKRNICKCGDNDTKYNQKNLDESFQVLEFRTETQEIYEIVKILKKFIVEDGYLPSDICLVLPSDNVIKRTVEKFLNKFDIPFCSQSKVRMTHIPIVNAFIELVFIMTGKYGKLDLLKICSDPVIGLGNAKASDIRRQLKIKTPNFKINDWVKCSKNIGDQFFCEFVDKIYNNWLKFKTYSIMTLREWIEKLVILIDDFCIKEKILSIENDQDRANIWKWWAEFESTIDTLYDISTLLNDEISWDLNEFLTVFYSVISRVGIKDKTVYTDGISLRSINDMWGRNFKITILCSANKGYLKQTKWESWLFGQIDKTSIINKNEFIRESIIKSLTEKAALVGTVCSTTCKFYLSYSKMSNSGKRLDRDSFVDEILELASEICLKNGFNVEPNLLLKEVHFYNNYLTDSIYSIDELSLQVARNSVNSNFKEHTVNEFVKNSIYDDIGHDFGQYNDTYVQLVDDSKEIFNRYKKIYSNRFTEFDGVIEDNDILLKINNNFNDDFIWSVSMLKDYIDCPFKFLAKRILGIKRKDKVEEDPLAKDLGSLCHSVIKEVFVHGNKWKFEQQNKSKYVDILNRKFSDIFEKFDVSGIDISDNVWNLKCKKYLKQLNYVIMSEIDFISETDNIWNPLYFEWSFGQTFNEHHDPLSTNEPLILDFNGEKIKFKGIVDRIDVTEEGFFSIYDYKLGSAPAPKDIKSKADIQMYLYILAVGNLLSKDMTKVAGGSYYSIKNAKVESGIWQKDWADKLRAKSKRSGKMIHNEWIMMEKDITEFIYKKICSIKKGHFEIRPTRPCEEQYCEFRRICGFDPMIKKYNEVKEGELQ